MTTTHKSLTRVLFVIGCAAAGTSSADSVSGNFMDHNGVASASSGGTVTFTLAADGTVSASLMSTLASGGIHGFGFDSVASTLPESGFPAGQPSNALGWSDVRYGLFRSGFLAASPLPTIINWTIGTPGSYTSVYDVLGGPNPTWDFYLYSASNEAWVALAVAVPEPASYALMGLGVAALSMLRSRRR